MSKKKKIEKLEIEYDVLRYACEIKEFEDDTVYMDVRTGEFFGIPPGVECQLSGPVERVPVTKLRAADLRSMLDNRLYVTQPGMRQEVLSLLEQAGDDVELFRNGMSDELSDVFSDFQDDFVEDQVSKFLERVHQNHGVWVRLV